MANRAGLSCSQKPVEADLAQLLRGCTRSQRALLYQTAVSERMLQYYLAGRRPSKQALLAVLILLEQAADEPVLQAALRAQGYCLSESLANDAVVRWFLFAQPRPVLTLELLGNINAVLYELGLPLLISGHGKSYT